MLLACKEFSLSMLVVIVSHKGEHLKVAESFFTGLPAAICWPNIIAMLAQFDKSLLHSNTVSEWENFNFQLP